MFIYVILSLALILSVLGLTDIIHGIWLRLLKPKDISEGDYVVFLNKDLPFEQYRYFVEKYRWELENFAEKLIFVYEDEIPQVLNNYANKYNNVIFVEKKNYFNGR